MSTHVASISETWLGRNKATNTELAGVEKSEDIGFIRWDRGSRGGGVCVIYDKNRAHLKKYRPVQHKFEIVAARGNITGFSRRVVVLA